LRRSKKYWSCGDFVVPWFNGELRSQKPVLLYWLIMSAYQTFGVNEFAARFWSAVLAVGTALCTYAIGRRLFNANVGLWGAVLLLTSMMFEVAAHAPRNELVRVPRLACLVVPSSQLLGDLSEFVEQCCVVHRRPVYLPTDR
jgi:hypothetical protein